MSALRISIYSSIEEDSSSYLGRHYRVCALFGPEFSPEGRALPDNPPSTRRFQEHCLSWCSFLCSNVAFRYNRTQLWSTLLHLFSVTPLGKPLRMRIG